MSIGVEKHQDIVSSQEMMPIRRAELLLIRAMVYASFLFLTGAMCFIFFWYVPKSKVLDSVIKDHFLALTGTPLAAISAIILVAVFKVTSGDIQFKALGFEFRGAAGPAILWVVCFLSCVLGLRVLWKCS